MKIAQGKNTNILPLPYHHVDLIRIAPRYTTGISPKISSVELEIGQDGDRALWILIEGSDPNLDGLIDLLTRMRQSKANMARETEP